MNKQPRTGQTGAWTVEAAVIVVCLAGLGVLSAHAASNWKVGSFNKSTTTGNQTFAHGLGATPKAMMFWTGSSTSENWMAGYHFGLGFTDGTTHRTIGVGSEDAQARSNASRRIVAIPLATIAGSEVIQSEATFVSWDATNVILNWTTSTATADAIHYLGIGGSDISAKVLEWTMPASAGNKTVTGVGFKPDVIFSMSVDRTDALPASIAHGDLGMGACDASGDQNGGGSFSWDNGVNTDTARAQMTDHCLVTTTYNLLTERASFTSMDNDGFTLNCDQTVSGVRVFTLALKGLNVKVGSFTKSTTTPNAMQTVTHDTFTPKLVMLYGSHDTTLNAHAVQERYGFGASDGTTHGATSYTDEDAAGTSNVDSIDKTSKAYIKANNNTATVDAEASVSSFISNGFVLNWSTNDAVATNVLYISMGALPGTAIKLAEFEAELGEAGVALRWRTGWETDNVGFHLYRVDGKGRVRVTPWLVAGSTFLVGGTRLGAGHSYEWWDEGGGPGSQYWLEDVDVSGRSAWSGPFTIHRSASRRPAHSRALTALQAESPARVTGRPVSVSERALPAGLWSGAGTAAVKIGTRERGLYRIDRSVLQAAGLPASVDPRKLHMYVEGNEVAIGITGAWAGAAEQGEDALEFFAAGAETPYTDEQVFWLLEEAGEGKRILRVPATKPEGGVVPSSVLYRVKRQDRSVYFAALHNGDEENFFGSVVDQKSVMQTIPLKHLAQDRSGSTAEVSLSLQGVTLGPHEVSVSFNGRDLGTVSFADQGKGMLRSSVPHSLLLEGANELALTAKGGEKDIVLVDWLAVQHWRQAIAEDDRLEIEASQAATIGGFTAGAVRVMDVTAPEDPREILLPGPATQQGGQYVVNVGLSPEGPRVLWAGTAAAVRVPAWVRANAPTRWRTDGRGGDQLIIVHGSLLPALEPLKQYREGQGASVELIDIEDVYDEMSYGVKTPWALRSFLREALDGWNKKPRSVLLVGDASLDPKGYLGKGRQDLLPSRIVDTPLLEAPSDDWFTTKEGEKVAEIPVGRLPAQTAEEASLMVAKVLAYEAEPLGDRKVLLVADRDDEYGFQKVVHALRGLVPPGRSVQELSRARDSAPDVIGAMNEGPWLVSYAGHGSVEQWAGSLLTTAGARELTNGNRRPIVAAMTCLNGFFHDVYTESLAEGLLRAERGGAAGVWASSAVTPAGLQVDLNHAFVGALMGTAKTLGEAVQIAKRSVNEPDVSPTWILLGDPAMRLPISSDTGDTGKAPAGGCDCRANGRPASRFTAVASVVLAFAFVARRRARHARKRS